MQENDNKIKKKKCILDVSESTLESLVNNNYRFKLGDQLNIRKRPKARKTVS